VWLSLRQSAARAATRLRALRWPRRHRPRRRRPLWRRLLRIALVGTLLLTSAAAGTFYAMVRVPYPDRIVEDKVSLVTYADGTPMATLGVTHRIDVPLSRVPVPVRDAVLAAENRDFYSDPGFSIRGTMRAALSDLRGKQTQGGSTLSQQYVKNAYLTSERTLRRKVTELAVSIKLNRDYPKGQILEWYLNTICFGRGAFGIEAAAETFFGKQVQQLTAAEGAVLAGGIRAPALYDPQSHPVAARERWAFVLDAMVQQGWLDRAERDRMRYPRVLPPGAGLFSQNAGPNGIVLRLVREELARNGFDEARLNREHLRVVTTVDSRAQRAAIDSMHRALGAQPGGLRSALVSLDPHSGAIRAYYGNANGVGLDYAQAWRQPGSTFKPIALAVALEHGIPVWATFDGSSPRTFYGLPHPLRNDHDTQCPVCTLVEATTRSINTAYYDLTLLVGGSSVAQLAHRLGIPDKDDHGRRTLQERLGTVLAQIVLGKYEVRPYDLARVYATFASGGIRREPYLVSKVVNDAGRVVYRHRERAGRRVLAPDVANDVAYAMQQVPKHTGHPLHDGRPAAAKTGTVALGRQQNKDAWMAGFTRQLSTVVWIGSDRTGPIRTTDRRPIDGGGLPAAIWQRYTDAALAGQPVLPVAGDYPQVGAYGRVFKPGPRDGGAPPYRPSTGAQPTPSGSPVGER
jgi:membrane peptidoglycan carboxypeptidase